MLLMNRVIRVGTVALLLVAAQAGAQTSPLQLLKDAWVGTTQDLYQIDYDAGQLTLKTPRDSLTRNFVAIAFEQPTLGSTGAAVRNLVAVDGTRLLRYTNGSDVDAAPQELFNASNDPSALKTVTALAVTPSGSVLFAGYSRPKRVFELWELTEVPGGPPLVQMRATGTPNLTDAVFVPAEDVVPGSALTGGGLLAAAGRQVLFFPANRAYAMTVLIDAKTLGVKSNSQLLSVDLVRKADALTIATSERTLLTTAPTSTTLGTLFATLPDPTDCRNLKPQRILVRSARGGTAASSIVSDLCGQVLRYDFSDPFSRNNAAATTVLGPGLVVLAVGEGNEIHCDPHVACELTTGFTANIDTFTIADLLVLQFDNLCDRRVAPVTCQTGAVEDGYLVLNSLLPQSVQDNIDPRVKIKLPPSMSSASADGRFGALLVQADPISASSNAAVELEYRELGSGVKLDVALGLPRPTSIYTLLNQDVAAYAPDNYDLPTVRGFEATPITSGKRNPMTGSLRGFSAIFYGLQHDVYPPSPRAAAGGIYPGVNPAGATPICADLVYGGQVFPIINAQQRFFANLSACLFTDLDTLLKTVIPGAALSATDRATLSARLDNTKDKLIKALTATGPNSGSQTFQAVLSQLDSFDLGVAATTFNAAYVIYKNELAVRSKVFRFNLMERTYPSMPVQGF